MKNIVKNIVAALAFSVTAFTPGISAFAQNLPEGVYLEEKGLAYRKTATLKPGTTDRYIIDLEAFVTGDVTVSTEAVPADIVLVLDVSGSMDYTLYGNTTRMAALKTAVASFINTIHDYDLNIIETDSQGNVISRTRRKDADGHEISVGHRISIVKFAEPTYYTNNNTSTWINGSNTTATTDPGNHYADWRSRNNANQYRYYSTAQTSPAYETLGEDDRYNCTEVVQPFTFTADDADVTAMVSTVNSLIAAGSTASDFGMNLANLLLGSFGRANSSKTVVFFTDGSPTYAQNFDSNVASSAIQFAYTAKTQYKANVFTVGTLGNNPGTDVTRFMNYLSSNYPEARTWSQPGNPVESAKRNFYQNATGANLTTIFTTIAQSAASSGNKDVTAESAVTVDVLTSSFALPEGVKDSDITVLVAPCDGQRQITYNGVTKTYLTFGEEKSPTQYGLSAITPHVDATNNKVSTTGFDFSENYCWYESTSNPPKGHGYKQIIRFEITTAEGVVGGLNVATNDEESGIYLKDSDTPLIKFNRPTVEIPISIWIKKKGLVGEDSAVFTVYYTQYQEGVNPMTIEKSKWKSFTKITVNSDSPKDTDGLPMEKVVGLDPHYFYKIQEDAWAWSYTMVDGGTQYTFGEEQANPFTFENLPKETVKEGEATIRNVFKKKPKASDSTK